MPFSIVQIEPKGYILVDDKGNIYNHKPCSLKKCKSQLKAIGVKKQSRRVVKGGAAPITPKTPHDIFYVEHGYFPLWYFKKILGLNHQMASQQFHDQDKVQQILASGNIVDTGDPDEYGAGLTLSKAYINSWPVRVEVVEINNIIPTDFNKLYSSHIKPLQLRNLLHPMINPKNVLVIRTERPQKIFVYGPGQETEEIARLPFRILLRTTNGQFGAIALDDEELFRDLCQRIIQITTDPLHPDLKSFHLEQHKPDKDDDDEEEERPKRRPRLLPV